MAEEKEVNFEDLFAEELGIGKTSTTQDPDSDLSGEPEEKVPTEDPDLNVQDILGASDSSNIAGEEEASVESNEGVKDSGEAPVPDSTKEEKSSETQESTTLLFARFLSEQGNLTSFNEEDFKKLVEEKGEDEALSSLWNTEAETIRNNLLQTYDQDVKEYLEMLDTGVDPGVAKDISKTKKWLSSIDKEQLEDESKEELRKELIKHRYKVTTRFTDAKIDKLVERSMSLGEDVEEAIESLEDLNKHYEEETKVQKEAVRKTDEQSKLDAQKQLDDFKKQVNDMKEIVPGMELTPKQKQNIIDKLTKPVKEINGQPVNAVWAKRAEDPFKFDTIVAALDDIGVFDGKWDKLQKRVKSDTINQLKNAINSQTSQRSRAGAYGSDSDATVQRNIDSMRGLA